MTRPRRTRITHAGPFCTRRHFMRIGAASGAGFYLATRVGLRPRIFAAPLPGGTIDPTLIPKYQMPLVIPPAMPRTSVVTSGDAAGKTDYYEIAVRQFRQQILPSTLPQTTIWSYGAARVPGTVAEGGSFHYPALTIEAKWRQAVRVQWINDLVDANGNYRRHLLPVDQTLHWANPVGGPVGRDSRGLDPAPYAGPVPIVTHLHGSHTRDDSDGYAEAWFLPNAQNIPSGYATAGTWYDFFRQKFSATYGVAWRPGTATFQYPNEQRAATLWYHDHTLGMTRLNVYAGPAGFYLLRGGPSDAVIGTLPGPAPALGDAPGMTYFEIPIAIQDRAFNADGSLFYPDTRAFFEGLEPAALQIPFIPDTACDGLPSDVSPIWNPEFFGNTIVVNGRTWPFLNVEQRRYRLRILNGCNSRFLILEFDNALPFWQIGADGGFLPAPALLHRLLMAPAERADVIVDFTTVPAGTTITLLNLGPDEPFSGGEPTREFDTADAETTGQVMQFRVVRSPGRDLSTPPAHLVLPARTPYGEPAVPSRAVSLNEASSRTVRVTEDESTEAIVLDCEEGEPFGPTEAQLGTMNVDGTSHPLGWRDEVTETPAVAATEVWEIHNFTEDAHPIHIHEVQFEVVNRETFEDHMVRGPEPWETAVKDTVIAYPGEITRVKAVFDIPGQFVWHCHIVEHEDNEMMRPLRVGPVQAGQPES